MSMFIICGLARMDIPMSMFIVCGLAGGILQCQCL